MKKSPFEIVKDPGFMDRKYKPTAASRAQNHTIKRVLLPRNIPSIGTMIT